MEKEELESWFLFLYDELNIPKFSELEQAELVRDANQSKNPALNKEEMFILVTKVFEITIQKYIEELVIYTLMYIKYRKGNLCLKKSPKYHLKGNNLLKKSFKN